MADRSMLDRSAVAPCAGQLDPHPLARGHRRLADASDPACHSLQRLPARLQHQVGPARRRLPRLRHTTAKSPSGRARPAPLSSIGGAGRTRRPSSCSSERTGVALASATSGPPSPATSTPSRTCSSVARALVLPPAPSPKPPALGNSGAVPARRSPGRRPAPHDTSRQCARRGHDLARRRLVDHTPPNAKPYQEQALDQLPVVDETADPAEFRSGSRCLGQLYNLRRRCGFRPERRGIVAPGIAMPPN